MTDPRLGQQSTVPPVFQQPNAASVPGITFMPNPQEQLAAAINRLVDLGLGYRTTSIGNVTVTEPIDKRWTPMPCSKCHSEVARIRWHLGAYGHPGEPRCGQYDQGNRGQNMQHLHVYCEVCHFDWTEALPST